LLVVVRVELRISKMAMKSRMRRTKEKNPPETVNMLSSMAKGCEVEARVLTPSLAVMAKENGQAGGQIE